MTTATLSPTHDARTPLLPASASQKRVRFPGILRSEWIKLRSLRSTVWSYAMLVLISLGLAILMAATLNSMTDQPLPNEIQAGFLAQVSSFPVALGQLIVAVLGVLVISGEYSTGMIRSTFSAVPRRLPVLWAKGAVLFVSTFVVGLLATVGAYLAGSPILAANDITAPITDPDVTRAIVGGALYLALVALFALGVGTAVRSSAGGIATVLGIVLILPTILQLIPADWAEDVLPYLLSDAGLGLVGLQSDIPGGLDTWQQLAVVLGWVAASLTTGAILMKRRDA